MSSLFDPHDLLSHPRGRFGANVPPRVNQTQSQPFFSGVREGQSRKGEVRMVWIRIIVRFFPESAHRRLGGEQESSIGTPIDQIRMTKDL